MTPGAWGTQEGGRLALHGGGERLRPAGPPHGERGGTGGGGGGGAVPLLCAASEVRLRNRCAAMQVEGRLDL